MYFYQFLIAFIIFILIIALFVFLFLFKKGKLVKKNWAFILAQSFTIAHCVLRIVSNVTGVNNTIGKSTAAILLCGVAYSIYLKTKGDKPDLARYISVALIILSFINLYW